MATRKFKPHNGIAAQGKSNTCGLTGSRPVCVLLPQPPLYHVGIARVWTRRLCYEVRRA